MRRWSRRNACRRRLPVLCLDLDGFKLVNDTLGHAAGDALLCQVADRLRDNLRENDFVARIGGDEFVVLQITSNQPHDAAQLAQRIIACLAPAFRVEEQDVNVGVSIGIAVYPEDGETATALLKKADVALYRTKETGRGWFRLFENGMDRDVRQRRELEQELRTAFQNDEFVLYFQPLFDRNLELVAFEALVRWMHPTRGLVPPMQFIPLAEECGLIIPLGEWVMRTACTRRRRLGPRLPHRRQPVGGPVPAQRRARHGGHHPGGDRPVAQTAWNWRSPKAC